MKHIISAFFISIVLIKADAQNINFTLADPQPVIQEVYGGKILSGDLDNDGDIDLVQSGIGEDLMGLSARASVFLNDGNGNFIIQDQNFNDFWSTEEIAIGDFDNDNDLDLIITAQNRSDLYLNDGQANFIFEANLPLETISFSDIIVGDVDGDDNLDVIQFGVPSSTQFPPVANLYFNNGSGVFTVSQNTVFLPFRQATVEFIDLEGDGDLDVLSFGKDENNESQVGVYENDGTGNYSIFSNSNIAPHLADEISVGDIDDDGDEDVLITGSVSGGTPKTILYLNDGAGQFSELMNSPFPDFFAGTSAFADLDNDNDLDILLVGSMAGGLPNIFSIVFENLGSNSFVASDSLGGEYIAETTIADFNGNGKKDIIIQGFVDDTNIYWNESLVSNVEEVSDLRFSVYPNPSNGEINVDMEIESEATLNIYSLTGQLVFSNKLTYGDNQLMLNIPHGIYLAIVEGSDFFQTQKLIISSK